MTRLKMPGISLCLLGLLSLTGFCDTEEPLVTTKSGRIRGKIAKAINGKVVHQYLGIPFATPPVGDLRFRHPRPVEAWDDVFNATTLPPTCTQKRFPGEKMVKFLAMLSASTKLSEDCLYLNVYVPETRSTKLSVIVYIYGGAFSFGTSSALVFDGSTFAAEENVIVVNFNYRVALFGFLYMDHPEMDSNNGMMDQVMALKWIHANIASFGGDPNSITLVAQSSGAASIGFHIISNMSNNYFNRAILQSGNAISEWAVQTKEENFAFGKKLINYMECPHPDNVTDVVRCLKEADYLELSKSEPTRDYDAAIFRPVIDGFFIAEDPTESMRNGRFKKMDIITGLNRDEGTPFLIGLMPMVFNFIADRVTPNMEDFENLVPETLRYASPTVLKAVIFEYTPWRDKNNPKKVLSSCNHMFSDYYFNCGSNEMARYFTEAGQKVYQYFYTHSSDSYRSPKWMGTFHGAEIPYVFGHPLNPKHKYTSQEKIFSRRIMRYWANFARTGDPNVSPNGEEGVEWPRYQLDNREALVLAPNTTAVMTNYRRKPCAFWTEFVPYIENLVKLGQLEKRIQKWY